MTSFHRRGSGAFAAALLAGTCLSPLVSWAQDATWRGISGDFNAGTNWSTGTVPTGVANFNTDAPTKSVTFSAGSTTIGTLQLVSVPDLAYTYTIAGQTVTLTNGMKLQTPPGNSSGFLGTFNVNAGGTLTLNGGSSFFVDFNVSGAAAQLNYRNDSISNGSSTNITVSNGGSANFFDTSTAQLTGFTVNAGASVNFFGASSSSISSFTLNGGTVDFSGSTRDQSIQSLNGGSGSIIVGSGGLDISGSGSFGGVISGSGSLTVSQGGDQTLSGTNTYTGATAVNAAGRLVVNGSIASNVTVNDGFSTLSAGTLAGGGTINGNVTNNGIVAPGPVGNYLGTLNVTGTYTNNSTGIFRTVINTGATNNTRMNVTGAATLNGGTVQVSVFDPTTFKAGSSYTLITAGNVAGTFAGVSSDFAFIKTALSYDSTHVYLQTSKADFTLGAYTPGQTSFGNALNSISGSASGDLLTVVNALGSLSAAQAPAVMKQISGQAYSGTGTTAVAGAQAVMANFASQAGGGHGGQTALARGDSGACDEACDFAAARWGAWGNGIGAFGTVAGDANTTGTTYSLGGFSGGLDYRFSPQFLAGVTLGYTNAVQYTQTTPGRGTSETVHVGLYGELNEGSAYLDALAGYARGYNRMTRQITIPGLAIRTAQGGAPSDQFFGQLEGGYKLELGGSAGAFVTPFARLQASTTTQQGFTETGADALDLTLASQTANSFRSILGARIGAGLDTGWHDKLNMAFRLGWAHEYADTAHPVAASFAAAPAASFTTTGAATPRDGVILGLSADTSISDATSLYARYDGDLAGDTQNHAFTAGVRMVW